MTQRNTLINKKILFFCSTNENNFHILIVLFLLNNIVVVVVTDLWVFKKIYFKRKNLFWFLLLPVFLEFLFSWYFSKSSLKTRSSKNENCSPLRVLQVHGTTFSLYFQNKKICSFDDILHYFMLFLFFYRLFLKSFFNILRGLALTYTKLYIFRWDKANNLIFSGQIYFTRKNS